MAGWGRNTCPTQSSTLFTVYIYLQYFISLFYYKSGLFTAPHLSQAVTTCQERRDELPCPHLGPSPRVCAAAPLVWVQGEGRGLGDALRRLT